MDGGEGGSKVKVGDKSGSECGGEGVDEGVDEGGYEYGGVDDGGVSKVMRMVAKVVV